MKIPTIKTRPHKKVKFYNKNQKKMLNSNTTLFLSKPKNLGKIKHKMSKMKQNLKINQKLTIMNNKIKFKNLKTNYQIMK